MSKIAQKKPIKFNIDNINWSENKNNSLSSHIAYLSKYVEGEGFILEICGQRGICTLCNTSWWWYVKNNYTEYRYNCNCDNLFIFELV
jgi:hypothetical protein